MFDRLLHPYRSLAAGPPPPSPELVDSPARRARFQAELNAHKLEQQRQRQAAKQLKEDKKQSEKRRKKLLRFFRQEIANQVAVGKFSMLTRRAWVLRHVGDQEQWTGIFTVLLKEVLEQLRQEKFEVVERYDEITVSWQAQ